MSLFDPTDFTVATAPVEELSATRRLTLRRRADLTIGRHPVTGLPLLDAEWDFTCGTCAHMFTHRPGMRTFTKCALNATRGPATDVRKSWPACTRYRIDGPL